MKATTWLCRTFEWGQQIGPADRGRLSKSASFQRPDNRGLMMLQISVRVHINSVLRGPRWMVSLSARPRLGKSFTGSLRHDQVIQAMIRDRLSRRSIASACSLLHWACCICEHFQVPNSAQDLMKLTNAGADVRWALVCLIVWLYSNRLSHVADWKPLWRLLCVCVLTICLL